jgi:tRNA (guanine-N7-)-methyltransferase
MLLWRRDSCSVFESALTTEVCLDPPAHWIDFEKLFGRKAPVQVDLGCGDGLFLSQMASQQPEKNFLGIERLAKRVTKTARKAARLPNMRVLRVDTSDALDFLLPPDSVEAFYLLFPDPWPKRRHHRRRIVTVRFLELIYRALEPNGIFRIATDHADYFRQIEQVAATSLDGGGFELDCFKQSSSASITTTLNWPKIPQTKFEQRFCAAGLSIYRLSLRKVSPVT